MKKSNENLIPLDFSPVDEQFGQLADTLYVNIYIYRIISFKFSFFA